MNRLLRISIVLVFFSIGAAGQTISENQVLWNGKNASNWKLVIAANADIDSVCKPDPEGGIFIAGTPVGYLATVDSFENYKLHLEYRWPAGAAKNSNSGVLVHIASGPIDRNTWPLCFQIQTKISHAGDVLPMAGAKFKEPLSTPPNAKTPQLDRHESDSENSLGEWNNVDIVCNDSTIECMINGIVQNRISKCEPHAGKIGLQMEGFPFEVRHIWLTKLK